MWVENIINPDIEWTSWGHPPREDVSWKIEMDSLLVQRCCHPPREDVSWKTLGKLHGDSLTSHPPREDVSWKNSLKKLSSRILPSSSSWGCELKNICTCSEHKKSTVILLVRMWVEKFGSTTKMGAGSHPPREDVSWKDESEMKDRAGHCHPPREDVSWKTSAIPIATSPLRHPPREDVSWKDSTGITMYTGTSHPPREDVSWKVLECSGCKMPVSSSSWGCELKRWKRHTRPAWW